MDRASQVLAQSVPASVPASYRALADYAGVPRSTLHYRAHGRRSIEEKAKSQQYLSPPEEQAVVNFLLQMSDLGRPVRMKDIPALAFCATRQRPQSARPPRPPGRNWAKAFENRHPEVQARRVRALDWNRHDRNTHEKINHWFKMIAKVLQDPQIVAENVYNMDETGVMLSVLGSVKVLTGRDDTRDYRGAHVKRTTVTAIECISGDGKYLYPMIIWPAATHRSNWTTFPTPGWHYAWSESGYTDSWISLEWLKRVFDPQTKAQAGSKHRVLICDGFGTHETLEVLEYCFANDIILCRLPSHTSHKLQPCDIAVFGPLKVAYRDYAERLERGGVGKIGKEHFTSLYSPARDRAFTKRNILAGWSKAGLFPFNPGRVLRDISSPSDQPASTREVRTKPLSQEAALQLPSTPVSAETLTLLQDLIVEQDAQALNDASKRRLQRHLHKLAKAAQMAFARSSLQEDQIRFFLNINNEAKARRSARSTVLGKARIMSYEDLEEARAKRKVLETVKEARSRKRVQKLDGSAQDTGAPGHMDWTIEAPEQAIVPAQDISERQVAEEEMARSPWRALVARMW